MSRETRLPASGVQQQQGYQAPAILGPHFSYLNYLMPPTPMPRANDRVFRSNADLWRAVLEEDLRAHAVIRLEGFRLFEWFPRAPGLFHTDDAEWARHEALSYLDYRFPQAPINADHAGVHVGPFGEHTRVFNPHGKQSMLGGGVGCVRLKPIERNGSVLWLMSASSSGVAHEGFPLAVPNHLYHAHIGEIKERGAAACTMVGELRFFPQPFSGIFGGYRNVPQLYLEVLELVPATEQPDAQAPEVSVAVSFVSSYEGPRNVYATYVTFNPGRRSSFDEAREWLEKEYVRGGYQGRIITDFDQTKPHFDDTALSLRRVMGRHLQRGEVAEVVELMHAWGDVDRLFDKRDLEEMDAGVARTRVFVSYSHKDERWLERVLSHLKPLTRENNVDVWADKGIEPGSKWAEEIDSALESAKVGVLLISSDFFASDFIAGVELPRLLAAADAGRVKLLAVILSPTRYDKRLRQFQAVNDLSTPVIGLPPSEQEQVFASLSVAVEQALK